MSVKKFKLAEAYVIPQEYRDLFDIRTALRKGTIFKELYRELPWKREDYEDECR
ncbi:spore coat associated protein CotJA [Clostridium polynesiense]|uniref:spore coat associated protein CotJA n=1 Tax=Clostridium polynesiense TaxID=1325933 RepID=UPI0009E5E251|nr:spore coat associated protein CotJA [Clostridium polynesiense]